MKGSLFLAVSTLTVTVIITGCWGPSKRDASNIAISNVEQFRKANGRLPNSLSEAGAEDDESCPCYCKTGNDSYLVWYGTTLGESDTYDSETRKWSPRDHSCACSEYLKESHMSMQVEHIEMAADVMGNQVNIKGIALMEVTVDNDGRVFCVQALSGHPLAITHLIEASRRWKFKPYLKNGRAQRFCGRLLLNFSFVENKPFVEVVSN